MKLRVRVYKDSQLVTSFESGQGGPRDDEKILIGRSKEAIIQLSDRVISRKHAHIFQEGPKWKIQSLSKEIVINGKKSSGEALSSGDSLGIGPFTLIVDIEGHAQQEQISEVTKSIEETPPQKEGPVEPHETQEMSLEADLGPEEAPSVEKEAQQEEEQAPLEEEMPQEEGSEDEYSEGEFFSGDSEVEAEKSLIIEQGQDHFEDHENIEGDYHEDASEDFSEDASEDFSEGESEDHQDDDSTKITTSFADYFFEISGEFAPYDQFFIVDEESIIGRHLKKCQIVLNDPEVSSVHASIKKVDNHIFIEDLQSGNGTLVNGERVNKKQLSEGDEVVIGSTTFTLKIKSSFLKEESERLMPVEEDQEVTVEEIVEVSDGELGPDSTTSLTEEKSVLKKIWKDPKKRRYLIIGLALFAMMLLLDEEPTQESPAASAPKKTSEKKDKKPPVKKADIERENRASEIYKIAKELAMTKKYEEALQKIDQVLVLSPKNNEALTLKGLIEETLKKLAEAERKLREKKEKEIIKERVKKLLVEAQKAVKERDVIKSEGLFQIIGELDPENYELPLLKSDLDAWKKNEEKKAVEKAQKEAERKRQMSELGPGKNFYLQEKWHQAIGQLERFLSLKDIDEDLLKKATKMLEKSNDELKKITMPLLGKARSLKEGQDLKGAYEQYGKVLHHNPRSQEARNERDRIRKNLTIRSKKIYRDAIISESLSRFDEAKERFQQVQQISPTDSPYYQKATDKLRQYID